MAIRNYRELSTILKNIVGRLLTNQTLCKLLYYDDKDPLSKADFVDTKTLLNKQVRITPRVGPQENTKSKIVLLWTQAQKNLTNNEITDLNLRIYVYTPLNEWVIEGDELRMFLILSEIEETLQGKDVYGLGKLWSKGFTLDMTTDEVCAYRMEFKVDVYS